MSREIKFRFWDTEQPAMWSQDDIIDFLEGEGGSAWTIFNSMFGDDYWIPMQYTGLKDKNGKEIFEGDILKFIKEHEEGCLCEHCWPIRKNEIVVVKWVYDRWQLLPLDSYKYEDENTEFEDMCAGCASLGGLYSPNHEVPVGEYAENIGNIYENPELLEDINHGL